MTLHPLILVLQANYILSSFGVVFITNLLLQTESMFLTRDRCDTHNMEQSKYIYIIMSSFLYNATANIQLKTDLYLFQKHHNVNIK